MIWRTSSCLWIWPSVRHSSQPTRPAQFRLCPSFWGPPPANRVEGFYTKCWPAVSQATHNHHVHMNGEAAVDAVSRSHGADPCLPAPAGASCQVHGVATWFDVLFDGTTTQRWLSTAPGQPTTHWCAAHLCSVSTSRNPQQIRLCTLHAALPRGSCCCGRRGSPSWGLRPCFSGTKGRHSHNRWQSRFVRSEF